MKRYRLKKALPTFKAGEVFVLWDSIEGPGLFRESDGIMAYHRKTLDKFPNIMEEWFEEIKPVELLIKDETIRKVVRAWADGNNIESVHYDAFWTGFRRDNSSITVWEELPLEDNKVYTIAELCGEEE